MLSVAWMDAVRARCPFPVDILTHFKGMLHWWHLSSSAGSCGAAVYVFSVLGHDHLSSVSESVSSLYQALLTASRVMLHLLK